MTQHFSITLVQCPLWSRETPPLAMSLLAGNLRTKGFNVHLFDLNNEFHHKVSAKQKRLWYEEMGLFWLSEISVKKLMEEYDDEIEKQIEQIIKIDSQIVGFTCYDCTLLFSLEIAKRLKAHSPDTLIVLGGRSTTMNDGAKGLDLLKNSNVDAVVFGEGDETLPEMCTILKEKGHFEKIPGLAFKEDGQIIQGEIRNPIGSMDVIPFPDYGDFDLTRYNNSECLDMFSCRGCINTCHFCNDQSFFKRFRSRSGKSLLTEVKYHMTQHPNVKFFNFSDSALNGSLKTVYEFSELLLENNIKIMWGGFAIVRKEMTPEALNLMAKAGCVFLTYGIESGSEKVRKHMNKIRFTNELATKVLKDTHNAGIKAFVDFMFGYPTETEEDFQMSLDFLLHNHKWIDNAFPSYALTAIIPDTYLYNNPEEFGMEESNKHIIFWETKDGKNTFMTRMNWYIRFCKLCMDLGLDVTDPEKKEDKWKVMGSYYSFKRDFDKVHECYRKDLHQYGKSKESDVFFLESCLNGEELNSSNSYK